MTLNLGTSYQLNFQDTDSSSEDPQTLPQAEIWTTTQQHLNLQEIHCLIPLSEPLITAEKLELKQHKSL